MMVYRITNLLNGLVYIGKTFRNISSRIAEHKYKRSLVGQAISDIGLDNFKIEVIDHANSLEELKERERFWIEWHNSFAPNGHNKALGDSKYGDNNGFFGKRHCKESIARNKEHQRNRKAILHLDTGVVYSSTRECARELGISKRHVQRICKGLINASIYHLQYAN